MTFVVDVECATESGGVRTTVFSGSLDVTDGARVTALDDAGNPVLLPAGARRWASESDAGGADTVTIDHDSFETAVEVLDDPTAGAQDLTISVTNFFDPTTTTTTTTSTVPPTSSTSAGTTTTTTTTTSTTTTSTTTTSTTTTSTTTTSTTTPSGVGSGTETTVGATLPPTR